MECRETGIFPMTHCPKIYFSNVCNSYLDLAHIELTQEQFESIVYYLLNPKEVPFAIRARVVDFTNIKVNGSEITKDLLPIELFDSKVNYVFT